MGLRRRIRVVTLTRIVHDMNNKGGDPHSYGTRDVLWAIMPLTKELAVKNANLWMIVLENSDGSESSAHVIHGHGRGTRTAIEFCCLLCAGKTVTVGERGLTCYGEPSYRIFEDGEYIGSAHKVVDPEELSVAYSMLV
jgi:hypothetical protein